MMHSSAGPPNFRRPLQIVDRWLPGLGPKTHALTSRFLVSGALAVLTSGGILAQAPVAELPAQPLAEPVRLEMPAFGTAVEIEVRDLPRADAEAAIQAALTEVHNLSLLLDPDSELPGSLGDLNRNAGIAGIPVDPKIQALVVHGLRFCLWSAGAHGPLGGAIYELWQTKAETGVQPNPYDLRDAVATANCDRLQLDDIGATAALSKGSRIEARGMVRGFAIDRAIEVLREHGVSNAVVEIDWIIRAIGRGHDGRGWLVAVPGTGGTRDPLDQLWLHDQSLALLRRTGNDQNVWVDQRTGVPARGVVQVATVTAQAVDADALAATLFVLGLNQGQRHLGQLKPRPSVLFLLGNSSGIPLESPYRWSELDRVRRR